MVIHLKRIFIFLAIIAGIVLITLMILFGQSDEEHINATWNKLKSNDSLFANEIYFTDSTYTQFHTYRKIRPLNEADVNKMNIPAWKKLKLIAQLDTTAEHARPVMIDNNLLFLQEDMFKKQTAFIGSYISSDSTTGIYKETIYIPLKWHIIKPNSLLYNNKDYKAELMPANYTYADSACYVDVKDVNLTQPPIFKSIKH